MGQKVNPIAFRTGVMLGWKSRWYASKQEFAELLLEDHKVRDFIKKNPKKPQQSLPQQHLDVRRDVIVLLLQMLEPSQRYWVPLISHCNNHELQLCLKLVFRNSSLPTTGAF